MSKQLRKVTLYFSAEEHAEVEAAAEDEEVSIVRFCVHNSGSHTNAAPEGNMNQQPRATAREQLGVEKVIDANHA